MHHPTANADPVGSADLSEPGFRVYEQRHPAEGLTGLRVRPRTGADAEAVMRLPQGIDPSLGHLGMLADVTTARALTHGVASGQGIRTAGLHLHLAGTPASGALIEGRGTLLAYDGDSGLAQSQLRDASGALVATATGRFMVVDEEGTRITGPQEDFRTVPIPQDWDGALGIGSTQVVDDRAVLTTLPQQGVRNRAPIMHGGVQVRALDLTMRAAVGVDAGGSGSRLTDIAVAFHRPVPVDGTTTILMRAAVERRGRRMTVVTATLETADGRLLSSAQGTFIASPPAEPRPAPPGTSVRDA